MHFASHELGLSCLCLAYRKRPQRLGGMDCRASSGAEMGFEARLLRFCGVPPAGLESSSPFVHLQEPSSVVSFSRERWLNWAGLVA